MQLERLIGGALRIALASLFGIGTQDPLRTICEVRILGAHQERKQGIDRRGHRFQRRFCCLAQARVVGREERQDLADHGCRVGALQPRQHVHVHRGVRGLLEQRQQLGCCFHREIQPLQQRQDVLGHRAPFLFTEQRHELGNQRFSLLGRHGKARDRDGGVASHGFGLLAFQVAQQHLARLVGCLRVRNAAQQDQATDDGVGVPLRFLVAEESAQRAHRGQPRRIGHARQNGPFAGGEMLDELEVLVRHAAQQEVERRTSADLGQRVGNGPTAMMVGLGIQALQTRDRRRAAEGQNACRMLANRSGLEQHGSDHVDCFVGPELRQGVQCLDLHRFDVGLEAAADGTNDRLVPHLQRGDDAHCRKHQVRIL